MAILWRVWATSAFVILAVLVVFLALSTFQFSRVHSSLVGERLVVIADRTAGPFQAAARLGLPIADVRNVSGILERAKQTDDRISSIYLFDHSGRIVHATRGEAGDGPAVAELRSRQANAPDWHGEIGSGFVAGVNIPNSSGKIVGGIAVLYPRGGSTTRVWAMAAELSVAAVGIFAVGALAAGAFLRLGLHRAIVTFDRIEGEFAAFERDSWRGADPGEHISGLRAELDASFATYRSAVEELKAAGKDGRP